MSKREIMSVLLLCVVLAGSVACNPFGGGEEISQQLAEVRRGDLTVSVSGSGNIEVSNEARLAFGVGGRIDKIYVDEGDNVARGDVLAKLDTADLELALTQAQVAVTQAQVAVTQAELAVSSANVSLRTAKHSLEEARDIYTWPEIKDAQADVDDAKAYIDYVETNLEQATTAARADMWESALIYARARLTAAEAKLDAMVQSYDTEEVAIKKMEVGLAEQTLVLRRQSLEHAQQSLEQARQSLKNTQKQLDEATLAAPFDGVIASIDAKEGDVVPSPTLAPQVVIYLIDLTTMELKVEVDEIDIPGVKPGQRAIIDVDALPDVELVGEVISISPVAKEEAGVVLYKVTIGFAVPPGSLLKVGMSAEADIVTGERNNALLVPDRAIKQDSQGNPVVNVVANGQTEERPVVIGISDGLETEVVKGLNEGETVVQ